ncbi:MAG: hypothetical protein U1F25_14145 [Rubrivivax sp.]
MGLRSLAAEFLPSALQGLQGLQRTPPALPVAPDTTGPAAGEASSFQALADKIGYLGKADVKLVREAYRFADAAHLGQFRVDGKPYITHPLAWPASWPTGSSTRRP